jgi:hypothetical protein
MYNQSYLDAIQAQANEQRLAEIESYSDHINNAHLIDQ